MPSCAPDSSTQCCSCVSTQKHASRCRQATQSTILRPDHRSMFACKRDALCRFAFDHLVTIPRVNEKTADLDSGLPCSVPLRLCWILIVFALIEIVLVFIDITIKIQRSASQRIMVPTSMPLLLRSANHEYAALRTGIERVSDGKESLLKVQSPNKGELDWFDDAATKPRKWRGRRLPRQ